MIYFTVLKTKICISPLFFAVLTLILILDKTGVSGIAVLFSLLHELGHILALLCLKISPEAVFVTPFGIRVSLFGTLSTVKKSAVFIAGFFVNFILAAYFFAAGKELFGYVNLLIGIFTALPVASADGGSFLITILDEFFPENSKRIFGIISGIFMGFLLIVFALVFIFTKNFFILSAVLYMIFCAIKNAAN